MAGHRTCPHTSLRAPIRGEAISLTHGGDGVAALAMTVVCRTQNDDGRSQRLKTMQVLS